MDRGRKIRKVMDRFIRWMRFSIRDIYDLHCFISEKGGALNVFCFPDAWRLWLVPDNIGLPGTFVEIYNLEKRTPDRKIRCDSWPTPLNRCGSSHAAEKPDDDAAITVYPASGRQPKIFKLPEKYRNHLCNSIIALPDCSGYVAGLYSEYDGSNEEDCEIVLKVVRPVGSELKNFHVTARETDGEAFHMLCASRRNNMVFLYACSSSGRNSWQLFAFKSRHDGQLEQVYCVPSPVQLSIFTDEKCRDVLAFGITPSGPRLIELGEKAPELDDFTGERNLDEKVPKISFKYETCDLFTPEIKLMADDYIQKIESSRVGTRKMLRRFKKENPDPEGVLALINALYHKYLFVESQKMETWFCDTFPDHAYARLKQAELEIAEQNWQEAVEKLETMDRSALPGQWACHACHLLGIAWIGMGRYEEAASILEEAMNISDGSCDISSLAELAKALAGPEPEAGDAVPELWTVLKNVDDMLEKRDWEGVIASLERERLISENNLQLLARLASAWLNTRAEKGTSRWLYKMLVLARFYDVHSTKLIFRAKMLPDFVRKIPDTELKLLAAEAEAFFEQQ